MDHFSFHGVSVHIGQRLSPGKSFFFLVLLKQIHSAAKKKKEKKSGYLVNEMKNRAKTDNDVVIVKVCNASWS